MRLMSTELQLGSAISKAMRLSPLVLAVLICASPTFADAAPGGIKGPPAAGPGQGPGSNNGNGPAGKDAGPPGPAPGGPLTPAQITDDQDSALSAVESGEALPLSEISRLAVAVWGGRLIDAKLVHIGRTLAYRLTLADGSGKISHVLVDAKTGAPLTGGR